MYTRLLQRLRELFFQNVTTEEAWIDDPLQATPREKRLMRITRLCQWGAWFHGALAILLVLVTSLSASMVADIGQALLLNYDGDAGGALLLVVVGLVTTTSALLLLGIATQAQELWSPLLAIVLVAGHGVALVAGFLPAIVGIGIGAVTLYEMQGDWRAFHSNAVARRELRGRMRGVRAFAIITVFLAMMGAFTVLLYVIQLTNVMGSAVIVTGEMGRLLFAGIVGIELVLIIFIVPSLTAGAVTGERERNTYDLLQTTLLSAPAFLMGKMQSAIGYILLLLLSAIPLQSVAFIFGGVAELELMVAFIVLTTTGLLLGALGLYFSSQTDRTLSATVRVYTVALGFIVGVPIISAVFFGNAFGLALEGVGIGATSAIAETSAIYLDMLINSLNPISASYYTQRLLITQQSIVLGEVTLGSTGERLTIIAPWLLMSMLYIGGMALLIQLAIRRMRRGQGA